MTSYVLIGSIAFAIGIIAILVIFDEIMKDEGVVSE